MSHPTFASEFGKSYRQWQEDEADRKKAKKLRKSRLKEEIKTEKRATVRAAEAKLQASLQALEKRDKETMGDALVARDISTIPSEAELPSMRFTGADVEGEAYRQLTPMEAVRSRMPQGEPGTIENVRAQQSYLAGIEGAERRAAAEPEAHEEARLRLESSVKAQQDQEAEIAALAGRDFERKFELETRLREEASKSTRTREGRARLAKMAGADGKPFTEVTETIAIEGEGGLGGELHNAWQEGQKTNLRLSHAGRVSRSLTKGIADIRAGYTPSNPWDAGTDAAKIWNETVDIALLENPIKLQEALEQSQADLLKLDRDRKSAMELAEKRPSYKQAQVEFDKWWDGVVSRIPTTGGAAATLAQIAAEAQSRGIDPQLAMGIQSGALRGANRIGIPRYRDVNYTNFLKQNQGWFTSADLIETKPGGKPVGYNTAFTALRAVERKGDLDVAAQLKTDTATAVRLLDLHNGDLRTMAAAGVSPSVFKIAEDVVHRVGAEAASRVLGDKKTAGMKFEEALKFMNLPANTPYITEPLPSGEPETIVINSATGPKTVEIFYGTRFHPNLGRNLTPAEIKAAKDEMKQRSGFSRNNALSKKMGFDVWDIVK